MDPSAILVEKFCISAIGFDYPSLDWFANFLQHRQQCVRLQSITSTSSRRHSQWRNWDDLNVDT